MNGPPKTLTAPKRYHAVRIRGVRFVYLECPCGTLHAADTSIRKPLLCRCGASLRLELRP
jgi:hypothetical protein